MHYATVRDELRQRRALETESILTLPEMLAAVVVGVSVSAVAIHDVIGPWLAAITK